MKIIITQDTKLLVILSLSAVRRNNLYPQHKKYQEITVSLCPWCVILTSLILTLVECCWYIYSCILLIVMMIEAALNDQQGLCSITYKTIEEFEDGL